ncbi:MAG: dihydrolipoyl dehydrogenase [Polyangiaceae bacterium]
MATLDRQVGAVVIGGGPAGYSAAIRLAQAGIQTVCVERESVGGVCLNWGCIPSKALITTAQRYDWALHGDAFGISTEGVRLDLARAQERNRSIVRHHTEGVAGLIRSNGGELLKGEARLVSPRDVLVTQPDGKQVRLQATRGVVLATGARPRALPGFEIDGERILSAREAVFLERLPEHLIVLGGGVIGLELGGAYLRLGSKLTILEASDALLPFIDSDLVRVVEKKLLAAGATIHTGVRVQGYERTANGLRVRATRGEQALELEGSALLVAAGFVPNSEHLGLAELGVKLDARGHVVTNERCESNLPGLFAIGDVSGMPYLAHKAYKEAEVVAEVLRGGLAVRDFRALPSAIFSDPEIAIVGLSERDARAQGLALSVGRFPFSALGRAMALGETEGFVKLLADGGSARLLGAAVVGPEASELIAELSFAIEVGATLEDLSLTIHTHPTLSEAVREAAEHGLGHAIHIMNRKQRPAA